MFNTMTRDPIIHGPIAQSSGKAVPPRGGPPQSVVLKASGPKSSVRMRNPIFLRPPQTAAFANHVTVKPTVQPVTHPQNVGTQQTAPNLQQRLTTSLRRMQATRKTPGRVPPGQIVAHTIAARSYLFLSPAGRSTVTGVVSRPSQPFVPSIVARLKGGMF